jgi:hypothetical protein
MKIATNSRLLNEKVASTVWMLAFKPTTESLARMNFHLDLLADGCGDFEKKMGRLEVEGSRLVSFSTGMLFAEGVMATYKPDCFLTST